MALSAVRPAMNHEGKQGLHPFFSKPLQKKTSLEDLGTTEALADDLHEDADYEHHPTSAQPEKTRKKRSRKTANVKEVKGSIPSTKGQASLEQFARPAQPEAQRVDVAAKSNGATTHSAVGEEDDDDQDRRKRRKTESPGAADSRPMPVQSLDWHQQLQAEVQSESLVQSLPTSEGPEALPRGHTPPPPLPVVEEALRSNAASEVENTKMLPLTPKKQIKVTKTGKLVSSPPKPTPAPKPEETTTPKKRRGRKPAKAKVSSSITIIKYGSDHANRHSIGGRIEAILRGRNKTDERPVTPKKGLPKPTLPPKSTHPFFMGKGAQKPEAASTKSAAANQRPPTPRQSAVTPGKLRAEARRDRSPGPMPSFGMSLGIDRVTKQSGLHEASWPTRETAHVRNTADEVLPLARQEMVAEFTSRPKKAKNRALVLDDDEEVLARLAVDLAADIRRNHTSNKLDFAPPEDVRLPIRVLTTGSDIQRSVFEHIKGRAVPDGHSVELDNMHTAVKSLFRDIEHTLTPFDEGRCESQTWTQKYSPRQTSHILQTGKEATVLKDWLQSLTVMSVGGAHDPLKADAADAKKPPKKKRRKVVDNFIVSDDEEEDEDMIEFSDAENNTYMKSIRRPRWTRNNNVIVISGPHGCGKSATVYAVAKEMDFEVFEINSSTRRSGKDIQDKVGDMTANHLVNHKRPEVRAKEEILSADDGDAERIEAACQKDIESGRQGTMMTFFKAGPTTKSAAKVKPREQESKKPPPKTLQGMLPHMQASRQSQKQSLILFEEADIVFDEDQQFWASVSRLAAQSKRPIIITCNDERQIPMQDLPLAAILRLRPPPIDLATDYMLALAGREGHILERRAIHDLYHSKNLDLRASIAELDFWCQMSVGDRKGGLEWMYQRWPPGKDVDDQGRLIRVASEGTYKSGMGWLSHNVFEANNNAIYDKEEELLNELWADWDIDPTEWQKTPSEALTSIPTNALHALERLDTLSETLSAADVYCRVDLPSYDSHQLQPVDPTQPDVPEKTRLNYTLAAPFLQIDPRTDFLQVDASLHTYTRLLAERGFPDLSKSISSAANQSSSTETEYVSKLLSTRERLSHSNSLCRLDYAAALDILAAPPDATLLERTSFNLTLSSFDRTFSIITLDLAPYVRSIVAHEQVLESQRIRLSNLLSGGGTGKRARTTRASRVALEGGVRETKRRDRWFDKALNFELVMATAGESWTGMGWKGEGGDADDGAGSISGTQDSLTDSQDVVMQDTQE